MPKLVNNFIKGVMNKDTDKSLLTQDLFIHAENLRFNTNNGNDGIGTNIKGTLEVSDATDARLDYKCVGAYFDKNTDSIFYFLASDSGQHSKIVEYNKNTGGTFEVLNDDRKLLNFKKNGYITGINEIGGLLIFSEWGNNPRRVNVERAKAYGKNNFTEEDIALMVKPPTQKMKITLRDSTTTIQKENNIDEKMLAFSYRYRYLDGEYSPLAPFTNFAFKPKEFNYDFATQSNKAMVNRFNQVILEFNTGSKLVAEVQLVFKQSDTLQAYIIDDFDKKLMGWQDNRQETFTFDNLKSIRALPKEVLRNNYSNVPVTSKAQTLIDGRLILANYLEGFDIKDADGNKIEIDYNLELVSKDLAKHLDPEETVKAIRDYEVVIVYKDEWFRETTALSSKTNTIFVEHELAVKQNSIDVVLKSKPPSWAKYFQFFIRQNGKDYEQFLPVIFYEDGEYRWVKVEDSDIDKVKEGQYLYVKSDTRGVKQEKIKTKVLEVKVQDRNFLDTTGSQDVLQFPGTYIKIKPDGFSLDLENLTKYTYEGFEWSNRNYYPIKGNTKLIQPALFYGDGLDDIKVTGSFTGGGDARFEVEITKVGDGTSTFDQVTITGFDNITNTATEYVKDHDIVKDTAIGIHDGVSVQFPTNTGHNLGDKWVIRVKSDVALNNIDWDDFAMGIYGGPHEDFIPAGSIIVITYDEYGADKQYVQRKYTASKGYPNLEEWFYGDNIDTDLAGRGITSDRIFFRRGTTATHGVQDPEKYVNISADGTTGQMIMMIRSKGKEASGFGESAQVKSKLEISSLFNAIVFESEPKDSLPEIFYEIGKTYSIVNGFHMADTAGVPTDVNQSSVLDARIKLDWFNAWTFGNGVESYKIYDEFNQKGLDEGVRVTTRTKEEYKQVHRETDITWSDVYNDDSNFNGLSAFNLSLLNWITLDKENGSIQKIHNSSGNLMALQEEGAGLVPYSKNVIYDTQGGSVVGISTNILDKKSYRPYAQGKVGISRNPESFVSVGSRNYFTDKQRGNLIRLSIDGTTEINAYGFEYEFSNLMVANKPNMMIGGYDPKHKEYFLHLPSENGCLKFIDNPANKGFPEYQTFEPDFMLGADNEFYSWKNGKMYRHNATEVRDNFYGVQYESKIKFVVNHSFGIDKIYNAIGVNSTHPWRAKLTTPSGAREIPLDSFVKQNEYWFSEIMGNTNDDVYNNNVFGIGSYPVVSGIINVNFMPDGIAVGDKIISQDTSFVANEITDITGNAITLQNPVNHASLFLMFSKNQNIDGANIKGNFMEVELICDRSDKVELRSVKTEVVRNINT